MSAGIYLIKNVVNKKVYVGSAVNLLRRRSEHLNRLNAGTHHNKHLQNSWNLFGELAFAFIVIENCNKDDLIIKEQSYIEWFNATDKKFGYNSCKIAASPLGRILSEETKRKIGAKHKGKKLSSEHIEAMRMAFKGKKRDPKIVSKIAAAQTGSKKIHTLKSPEHKEKRRRQNIELANRRWSKEREKQQLLLQNLKPENMLNLKKDY